MKRFVILLIILLLTAFSIGVYAKTTYKNSGIIDMKTVADTKKLDCGMYYLLGSDMLKDPENMAKNLWDSQNSLTDKALIMIVKASGNIKQTNGSLTQEVTILKVIKGSSKYNEKKAYINSEEGFVVKANYVTSTKFTDSTHQVVYTNTICNLMQKDNIYLAFLMDNKLNKYYDNPIFNTNKTVGFVCYFNLTNNNSFVVDKDLRNISYNDFNGSEFLCRSDEVLNLVTELKEETLKLGGDSIKEYIGF